MIAHVVAISVGASLGALSRWGLGLAFNSIFPAIPPGTWLANIAGGFLMGVAMAYFGHHTGLSPVWRLFVMTGFLGSLTTFSAFSGEVVLLIQQGRVWLASLAISGHVLGSLVMTLLGIAVASALLARA